MGIIPYDLIYELGIFKSFESNDTLGFFLIICLTVSFISLKPPKYNDAIQIADSSGLCVVLHSLI